MRAAKESGHIPAGAFYFKIARPELNAQNINGVYQSDGSLSETMEDKLAAEERKTYLLDGVLLNNRQVANAIDHSEGQSDVVPAKKKDGVFADSFKTGKYLDEEDFNEYLAEVEEIVNDMCRNLEDGNIEVHPKMTAQRQSSCTYCSYRGICRFDKSVPGFRMAVQRIPPSGRRSTEIQFRSTAVSVSDKRSFSSPSVTVLSGMFLETTYIGCGNASPSPFRCPTVYLISPRCCPRTFPFISIKSPGRCFLPEYDSIKPA